MPYLESEIPADSSGGVTGLHHPTPKSELPPTAAELQEDPLLRDRRRLLIEALSQTGSAEMRRVTVSVDHRCVVLSGRVSSYYNKQVAQETIRPLVPGLQIENQILVTPRKPR